MNQSGPGNNGNEGVLHASKSSKTGTLSTDAVKRYRQDTYFGDTHGEMG